MIEIEMNRELAIFLDDVRDPPIHVPEGFNRWYVVRTFDDVIELISRDMVGFISFDHDLGIKETGYDVAKFIESLVAHCEKFIPPEYRIHSANPVGSNNIDMAMKNAHRIWKCKYGHGD